MERARRTTLSARANTETRVPGVTPGGVQQPSSRRPMATNDRNVPPSLHTNGAPQNRAASGDRLSPRPTLRQRRRSPSPAAVDRAMVPRPVGRGRWTTTPAWMHARTIGGLQHQASSGAQQERDRASATVGRHPSQVPPAVERESMNAATQGKGVASSGPQQLTSRRSLPTTGANAPPSPCIIGTLVLPAEAMSEWDPCGAKQLLAVSRSVGRAELMAEKDLGLLPRYHRARQRVPGSQERPPPTPAERETCWGRRQESIDQMEVGPVQGSTPREDNPSRREIRRAGAERVTANPTVVKHRIDVPTGKRRD